MVDLKQSLDNTSIDSTPNNRPQKLEVWPSDNGTIFFSPVKLVGDDNIFCENVVYYGYRGEERVSRAGNTYKPWTKIMLRFNDEDVLHEEDWYKDKGVPESVLQSEPIDKFALWVYVTDIWHHQRDRNRGQEWVQNGDMFVESINDFRIMEITKTTGSKIMEQETFGEAPLKPLFAIKKAVTMEGPSQSRTRYEVTPTQKTNTKPDEIPTLQSIKDYYLHFYGDIWEPFVPQEVNVETSSTSENNEALPF